MKFLCLTLILLLSSYELRAYHAKYPFLTIRKSPNVDSTPLTTVTCASRVKVIQDSGGRWVKVKVAQKTGYVYKNLLKESKSACISKGKSLLLNSLSLSAEEIYLWAKLGEHFIEGEVNDF